MKEISAYIASLEKGGKSKNTINTYVGTLKKFQAHFNLETVDQINALTVTEFMGFYNVCGEGNTLNSHIRNLSAFFTWLKTSRLISEDNAFFNVRFGNSRFAKVSKKQKVVFTQDEQDRIIAAGSNKQEKFMIAMMFHTAVRRGELGQIKLSDISGCEITITGKGGDESRVYLNDRLCAMMNEYLAEEHNGTSAYLFYGYRGADNSDRGISGQAINDRFQDCVKRAGINKKASAHATRRTAITLTAIKHGKFAAQNIARHANGETTDLYIVVGDELRKQLMLAND